jgi:hypothetical protein
MAYIRANIDLEGLQGILPNMKFCKTSVTSSLHIISSLHAQFTQRIDTGVLSSLHAQFTQHVNTGVLSSLHAQYHLTINQNGDGKYVVQKSTSKVRMRRI